MSADTKSAPDAERAAFEAWLIGSGLRGKGALYRRDMPGSERIGQYCDAAVEGHWQAWQAHAALGQPPAAAQEQVDAWRAVFDELSNLPGWADESGTGQERAINMIRRLSGPAAARAEREACAAVCREVADDAARKAAATGSAAELGREIGAMQCHGAILARGLPE